MAKKGDLKYIYISDKKFFDMEATIKEYFKIVPPQNRRYIETYGELYEEALKFVGRQSFDANTSDMETLFYELSQDEGTIAVMLGIIAYGVATGIDANGKNIERAIDKVLPKDYDTNNPFDAKDGYGHRVFGHDPVTFGLKNIPADTVIKVKYGNNPVRKPIRIGEFLGKGIGGEVSMMDLIWKFYGNDANKAEGIMNCIKHSIVHFSKDIFTPAGLPLPCVSLFNEYRYFENLQAHSLQYKDSLMSKCDNLGLEMKASDFASFFVIESFLTFYCKKNNLGTKQKGFEHDMKLIAMGTCLSLHMSTIVLGKGLQVKKVGQNKVIPGGKANVLMMGAFAKIALQEIISVSKERSKINKAYRLFGRS